MLRVVKGLAEVENAGAQIVQRRFVAAFAPEQHRQLPAQLAAIRAEGEIGEKHALALSRHRNFVTAGKFPQLEVAKQAKRPTSRCFHPLDQR